MVHSTRNRTATDGNVIRIFLIGLDQVVKVAQRTSGIHHQCRIIADGSGNQGQIPEVLGENLGQ